MTNYNNNQAIGLSNFFLTQKKSKFTDSSFKTFKTFNDTILDLICRKISLSFLTIFCHFIEQTTDRLVEKITNDKNNHLLQPLLNLCFHTHKCSLLKQSSFCLHK